MSPTARRVIAHKLSIFALQLRTDARGEVFLLAAAWTLEEIARGLHESADAIPLPRRAA